MRVERPRNLAIPPAGIPQNPEIHLRAHLAIRRKILPGSLDSSSSDGQGEAASSNGGDSDGSSDSDGGSDSDSGGDSDGSSDSDSGSAPGEAQARASVSRHMGIFGFLTASPTGDEKSCGHGDCCPGGVTG